MRIGISGTHGAGKTTLLEALSKTERLQDYAKCDEVTRWVKGIGMPINELGNDTTQELILMRHMYNLYMYRDFITDRTLLDCYVYSQYLLNQDRIKESTFEKVQAAFSNSVENCFYDYTFYIKPEFELVSDGVRSISKTYQKDIERIFDDTIEKYGLNKDLFFIPVTGTVEERVKQVLECIEE